jgi:pyruvate/2-oxoglutarate/acetoin dehydrogenase E1 component
VLNTPRSENGIAGFAIGYAAAGGTSISFFAFARQSHLVTRYFEDHHAIPKCNLLTEQISQAEYHW